MIALKSFDIKDCEKANKFMRENPPINTKDGSGIIMKENSIIVIYEDGTFNEDASHKAQVHFAINDAKVQLVSKRIGCRAAQIELSRMIDESVYMKEDGQMKAQSEITPFFQTKGLNYKQSEEMSRLVLDLCQKKWLAEKEIERIENVTLPSLEEMLK